MVIFCRLKILTYRHDIHLSISKLFENLDDLSLSFAESYHD